MSTICANSRQRTIVVPRQLEGFFQERLSHIYDGRTDIRVVVDRRTEDRRLAAVPAMSRVPERRKSDRRAGGVCWSLEDMPFTAAVSD